MIDENIAALRAAAEAVVREAATADGVSITAACAFAKNSKAATVIALLDRLARAEEALADANMSVVAFGAPWAVEYAQDYGLPYGHLHPTHYDILAKAGARMDAFVRAALEPGA
jgi:hypothetical protein